MAQKEITAEPETVVVEQPAKARNPLVIPAFIVGGVLVAGALFGGGVAVGANLPQSQGQFQGGPGGFPGGGENGFPGGGPGPVMPDQGTDGSTPDTDSN